MKRKTEIVMAVLLAMLVLLAGMQAGTAFESRTMESESDTGFHKSCEPTPKPTVTKTPKPTPTVVPTKPKPTPTAEPTKPKPTPTAQPTTPQPTPTAQPTTPQPTPTIVPTPVVTIPATEPKTDPVQSFAGGSSAIGGCGRNVRSYEPLANTRKHETKEEYVHKDKERISYNFTALEFLKGAGFGPNTTEGCVSAQGELLKTRSENTELFRGSGKTVFFNIWVGGIGYSDSNKVWNRYIVFEIPEELKGNKEISLMTFRNGSWSEIAFDQSSKNITAKVPYFGYFALTEKSAPAVVQEIKPNMTAEVRNIGVSEPKNELPWQAAVIAAIFIVILLIAAKYRKK